MVYNAAVKSKEQDERDTLVAAEAAPTNVIRLKIWNPKQ